MRIITWNCNGAFRKKFEQLSFLDADIYVIQECEKPSESNDLHYKEWCKNYIWIGENKNKGLGIFAKPEIILQNLPWSNKYHDHSVKYFLPCRVNNDFDLVGVWTHQNNSPNFGYIGQLWKYLQINKTNMNRTIIIGDFNSNSIWDQWDIWWNHSDVVKELKEIGIESFYHKMSNEDQGKETIPTLYLQRKFMRPYHIDYIFGPSNFQEKIKMFEIGKFDDWISLSDHMPIICEFNELSK